MVIATKSTEDKPYCPVCNSLQVWCDHCRCSWINCYCTQPLRCRADNTVFLWEPKAIIAPVSSSGHRRPEIPTVPLKRKKEKKKEERAEKVSPKKTPPPFKNIGCQHSMHPVTIHDTTSKDKVTIYCSAGTHQYTRTATPDFGLYASEIWQPGGFPHSFIRWQDFGAPHDWDTAAEQIIDAFIRACHGQKVEIGCTAGHGRTGTILACMFALSGREWRDSVFTARESYCRHAVETTTQEKFIRWFSTEIVGTKERELYV